MRYSLLSIFIISLILSYSDTNVFNEKILDVNNENRNHCPEEIFCNVNDSGYDDFICNEICYGISGKIIQRCSQSQYYTSIIGNQIQLNNCFEEFINYNQIPNDCSVYQKQAMNYTFPYDILIDDYWWDIDGDNHWDPHENYQNGWGVFLKTENPENPNISIHINHPISDINSDIIGAYIYKNLNAGYLLIAGSNRYSYVNTTTPNCYFDLDCDCGNEDECKINFGADTARKEDECNGDEYTTSFQLFHESLSTNIDSLISLSIHGFINDSLSVDNPPTFILSNGNNETNDCIPPDSMTSTIYHQLVNEFLNDFEFINYCGDDSIAVIVQQEIDCIDQPISCGNQSASLYSEYGAYSNPQGRYTNNTDSININTENDIWIHIEMDECIRNNYSLYNRAADVISEAIASCNNGSCEICDLNNVCSTDGVNYNYWSYDCTYLLIGDINEDFQINIFDLVLLIECVMSDECSDNFDIDENNLFNILDIVALVSIILNNTQ